MTFPSALKYWLFLLLAFAGAANANFLVFTLDPNSCSAGCWVSPLGTEMRTQRGDGLGTITVALSIGTEYSLRDSTRNSDGTVVFNLRNNRTNYSVSRIVSGANAGTGWRLTSPLSKMNDSVFGDVAMDYECADCRQARPTDIAAALATTTGKKGTGEVALKDPAVAVPDGGATALLLSAMLFAIEAVRRRIRIAT